MECSDRDWFAAASAEVSNIALTAPVEGRLIFTVGRTVWHLVMDGSGTIDLGLGPVDEPDVELRWSVEDAREILSRRQWGNEALLRTTVVAPDVDGPYVGPPAPLNLAGRRELETMPTIPGATFVVQYDYRQGPFGDVSYALSFQDGRLVGEELGNTAHADALVAVTYRSMALVRAGDLTILDALEGGRVEGSIGVLGALAGISESPEFQAAERATGRHAIALAALGDFHAHPAAEPVMSDLATRLGSS